jgi:hypothetical protein
MSGYQEILDQNILYIIIEKIVKLIPSTWIEAMCMFKLYEIYEQLQSENRCTIIKEKYFRNNAIERQMQQNKRIIHNT